MSANNTVSAIEAGLQTLYALAPKSAEYFTSILYDTTGELLPECCSEEILTQIEDDVMRFIQEA